MCKIYAVKKFYTFYNFMVLIVCRSNSNFWM